MDSFHIIELIGSGSYGKVYKAISLLTNKLVAIKVISVMNTENGVPVEVKYLSKLRDCKNIVQLTDHFYTNDNQLVMVFEYVEYDLWKFISPKKNFLPLTCTKFFIEQLLRGLEECHSKRIMHLDIKPSNLLIDNSFNLKLADFGFTTYFDNPHLTNQVISLFYRPPELLMGVKEYGPEVDIWSVGCIMAEMLSGNYLFAGTNEENQLDLIFRTFGTPTEAIWPGVRSIPGFQPYKRRRYAHRSIKDNRRISSYTEVTLDLLSKMLVLDPKHRISCKDALNHQWFREYPFAQPPTPSITQSLIQRPPKISKINSPLPNSKRIIAHQYYLNHQIVQPPQQPTTTNLNSNPKQQQQQQINKNSVQFLTDNNNNSSNNNSLDQSNHTSPSDNNQSPWTEPSSSSGGSSSDYFYCSDSLSSPLSSFNSDYSSPLLYTSKRKIISSYQAPLQQDYKRSRTSQPLLYHHTMIGTETNPIVIE